MQHNLVRTGMSMLCRNVKPRPYSTTLDSVCKLSFIVIIVSSCFLKHHLFCYCIEMLIGLFLKKSECQYLTFRINGSGFTMFEVISLPLNELNLGCLGSLGDLDNTSMFHTTSVKYASFKFCHTMFLLIQLSVV